MEAAFQDVETPSQGSTDTSVADSSSAVETSGDSQGSVIATDAAQTSTQQEDDPLKDVPTVEELTQLAEQKIPHAAALARLRPAYEGLKTQLSEYQSLDPWKSVAQTIGDPQLAQSAHELVSAIHSPVEDRQNYPSGFTSRPFLEQIDKESPGTAQQIFADLLGFPDVDPQGRQSTVVRELVRSWGLDPDRIDDYRNIDTLRASGVVTAEELAKIDPKYHEAFKSLPRDAQEDLLSLKESNPALAEVHLRNADRAMASERFEQQQQERERQAQEQAELDLRNRVETAVQEDISTEIQSLSNSIHQSLSSQWKPSSDQAANERQYDFILSTIATLQHPSYRFIAERALKSVGVEVNGFDDLANRWAERRSAYVTYTQMGDKWQANRALSEATLAKQQMLVKLNDYALKLAQANGSLAQANSTQMDSQLTAAQGRFVPSGNGQQQQGSQNPYASNPHPVGSQEYYAFNRKIDREYNLSNASVFG